MVVVPLVVLGEVRSELKAPCSARPLGSEWCLRRVPHAQAEKRARRLPHHRPRDAAGLSGDRWRQHGLPLTDLRRGVQLESPEKPLGLRGLRRIFHEGALPDAAAHVRAVPV